MTDRTGEPEASSPLRSGVVALGYLALATAIYWPALGAPLVSDDYYFLGIVAAASDARVVFEPLLDRFWRPLIVAMYYLSYHGWGLSPWPYHLFTLLAHVTTAWLLALCLGLLDPGVKWRAVLGGLIFLVFAGHSEAVAFAAGFADPAVGCAMLTAVYCYLRLQVPAASPMWSGGLFAAVAFAVISKETWVVLPGILIAHAVVFHVPAEARRRVITAIGGVVVCVLAYLLMRRLLFGNVADGYDVLSRSLADGTWSGQVRAFLLRCFAPAGHYVANLWLSGRDVIIWPVVIAVLAVAARGRERRMLVFAGLLMGAALLPVLPLSISVSNTESERYVYVATIFSSIVIVWALQAVLRGRPLVVAGVLAIAVGHAVTLVEFNRQWRQAGEFAQRVIHGIADAAQEHAADGRTQVFLLGLPDSITGPFVLRVGLYPALRLNRPDLTAPVVAVATVSMAGAEDTAHVERDGRTFRVDFAPNRIVQRDLPSTISYTVRDKTESSYTVEFSEGIDRALALYVTGGRVQVAGVVEGSGLPFGALDIPAERASCDGASVRFAGWALDADGLPGVRLRAPDRTLELGVAVPRPGMRPDVERAYRGFPDAHRAGWDFELPCAVVRESGVLRVQVVAEDAGGREVVIGERTVTTR